MTVRIRPAHADDLGVLEEVENAADRLFIESFGADHWSSAPPGTDRAAEPGFLLVAEWIVPDTGRPGSAVVGSAVVGFAHVLEIEDGAHLEQLSVLPDHGRQGVGRRLLEAAMTAAAERGHDRITLRTYADIPWNAPFYARMGFVETEPETPFQRRLVAVEDDLGLDRHGRRVQMTARLPAR